MYLLLVPNKIALYYPAYIIIFYISNMIIDFIILQRRLIQICTDYIMFFLERCEKIRYLFNFFLLSEFKINTQNSITCIKIIHNCNQRTTSMADWDLSTKPYLQYLIEMLNSNRYHVNFNLNIFLGFSYIIIIYKHHVITVSQ